MTLAVKISGDERTQFVLPSCSMPAIMYADVATSAKGDQIAHHVMSFVPVDVVDGNSPNVIVLAGSAHATTVVVSLENGSLESTESVLISPFITTVAIFPGVLACIGVDRIPVRFSIAFLASKNLLMVVGTFPLRGLSFQALAVRLLTWFAAFLSSISIRNGEITVRTLNYRHPLMIHKGWTK